MAGISRSVFGYKRKPDRNIELRKELIRLARKYPRLGSPMLYDMLRNKGWKVNHKRVERLYKLEKLGLKRRKKRRKYPKLRLAYRKSESVNECWSMDFVHDSIFSGRGFRCFALIDDFTRENLCLEAGYSLSGESVVELLKKAVFLYGKPERIRMDNGPEFRSKALVEWCLEQGIEMDFIEPGKPVQNCWIESFNGTFRDLCLNQEFFTSLKDAKRKISKWREFYNNEKPHSSLGGMPPRWFRDSIDGKEILARA
jgi:putative transposase